MRRVIYQQLLDWKESSHRLPLILRGARQVGKSHSVDTLGNDAFDTYIKLNFELKPQLKKIFEDLDPSRIIQAINMEFGCHIIPGKTLLFLDEIQECPEAIHALRYFKEDMPELHVIGAGSLLELAINTEAFKMPVGRVQYMHMYPLSFQEFLWALGYDALADHIAQLELTDTLTAHIHEKLLQLHRQYRVVGGMPAAVMAYREDNSYQSARHQQEIILSTYRGDFGKFSKIAKHEHLTLLFDRAPYLATQQFKYAKVSQDIQSRELKKALQCLVDAKILYRVYHTAANAIPLHSLTNLKKFKLLFLDIGLLQAATQTNPNVLANQDALLANQGSLAEQMVGQALLAQNAGPIQQDVFFWARDKKSAQAEVDYVINVHEHIYPIEVKAGTTGRLKSLKLFMEENPANLGIKICAEPLAREANIQTVPIYLAGQLKRMLGG